jgi:hypothetical protein
MSRSILLITASCSTNLLISSGTGLPSSMHFLRYTLNVLVKGCLPSGHPGQSVSTVPHCGLLSVSNVWAKPQSTPRSHLLRRRKWQSFTRSSLVRCQLSSTAIPGGRSCSTPLPGGVPRPGGPVLPPASLDPAPLPPFMQHQQDADATCDCTYSPSPLTL